MAGGVRGSSGRVASPTAGALLLLGIVVAGLIVSACAGRQAPGSPGATAAAPSAPVSPGPGGVGEPLPSPRLEGPLSLEAALAARRSIRSFAAGPLTRAEIGQLLWAAQGLTDAEGRRTAPSAGARYPLQVYAITVEGLARYVPQGHQLLRRGSLDLRADLQRAALDQEAVGEAPLVVVICAVVERTAERYGAERAERFVALEAGHAAQNVLLQAVSLGLGAVPIGAFDDAEVGRVLGLADGEAPLYVIPVGRPQ